MIKGMLATGILSVVLFLAFSYPLLMRFTSGVFAIPEWPFDTYGTLYGIWCLEYAFHNGLTDGINPMLAHPFGLDLSHSPTQPLMTLPLLLFSLLGGEIFSYNLFAVVNFALTGAISYGFFYYCTGHPRGSLLGSLIFTFSSNHQIQTMAHLGISAIQWIPLFVWSWFYLWEKPTWKAALFCAISTCFLFWSNYYFFYFSLFFVLCFFAVVLIFHRRKFQWGRMALLLAGTGLFTALLISPQLISFAKSRIQAEEKVEVKASGHVRPQQDLKKYAAHITDYMIPSENHPLGGNFTRMLQKWGIVKERHWSDRTLYLGAIALNLAPLVFYAWRRVQHRDRFILAVIGISTLFFIWFSLAPKILTNILYPIFPMFRFYCRAGFFVSLFTALMVAYVWKYHKVQFTTAKAKNIVCALVGAFILFDFSVVPPKRHLDLAPVPPEYAWLQEQKGDFAVAEFPFVHAFDERQYKYAFYQRVHGKKLVNGGYEGTISDALRKYARHTDDPKMWSLLRHFGTRYAVVHGDTARYDNNPSLKRAKEFADAKVYEIVAPPEKIYTLLWNFGQVEKGPDGRTDWRWIAKNAKIWFFNPAKQPSKIRLSFDLYPVEENSLSLVVNGKQENALSFATSTVEKKGPFELTLKPGENLIEFVPQSLSPHPSEKNREVSFRLSRITVQN